MNDADVPAQAGWVASLAHDPDPSGRVCDENKRQPLPAETQRLLAVSADGDVTLRPVVAIQVILSN